MLAAGVAEGHLAALALVGATGVPFREAARVPLAKIASAPVPMALLSSILVATRELRALFDSNLWREGIGEAVAFLALLVLWRRSDPRDESHLAHVGRLLFLVASDGPPLPRTLPARDCLVGVAARRADELRNIFVSVLQLLLLTRWPVDEAAKFAVHAGGGGRDERVHPNGRVLRDDVHHGLIRRVYLLHLLHNVVGTNDDTLIRLCIIPGLRVF